MNAKHATLEEQKTRHVIPAERTRADSRQVEDQHLTRVRRDSSRNLRAARVESTMGSIEDAAPLSSLISWVWGS